LGQERNKLDSSVQFERIKTLRCADFYYYNRGAGRDVEEQGDQAMKDTASLDKQNFDSWKAKIFYELTFSNCWWLGNATGN
jgi:hypothetical protein